jgi:hypothetical protein
MLFFFLFCRIAPTERSIKIITNATTKVPGNSGIFGVGVGVDEAFAVGVGVDVG